MKKVTINTILSEQVGSGRIELRHPRWAEFEAWVKLRRDSADYLSPWEPEWDEGHLNRSSYRARLSRFKKMVSNDSGYPFHIFRKYDDSLIGACNISYIQRHVSQSAQLGYWIGERYSRQGYGRAAVTAAVRFCFETLGLHRVTAAVQSKNTRSIQLLDAVGFTKEGTARGYLKINGVWQDHDIYAKLNSD